jgi:N-acetyl-anhydromuramyl-L-alanine amidase AmpD
MAINIDKTLRLPESEIQNSKNEKTGICLHHTVGGTARSSFNWWLNDNRMVGTAYLIARDGKIHEVFEPKKWAWQFGLKWEREKKIKFEKRFIGIEIASEGGLTEIDGKLYCFDVVSDRTLKNPDEVFDYKKPYRGYQYFDKYEPAQIDSVINLVNHLCDKFNIERKIPKDFLAYYGEKLENFNGIIGHVNVRKDKSDPLPDKKFWERIINECKLVKINISKRETAVKLLTEKEINELFENNIQQINKMHVPAGSMIKGLIMELSFSSTPTYIKLKDAIKNGHKVSYEFIQGDPGLVFRIGTALGLKSVTEDKLEVHNG